MTKRRQSMASRAEWLVNVMEILSITIFGRKPRGGDPMFFDPREYEPVSITGDRFLEILKDDLEALRFISKEAKW